MRVLKEHSDWPLEVDNQLRGSLKMILLQLHKKLPKNSNVNHSRVIQHLKQIGKVTNLDKWVPNELIESQKSIVLKYLLLLYATKTNHFSIILWYVMKSGFCTTTGNDKLCGWTVKFQSTSQSQTWTKKQVMVTVWLSVACLTHYGFLNPRKTITSENNAQQIVEYWKLQCLKLALVNRKGPVLHNNTQLQVTQLMLASKVKWIGLWNFCLICPIHLTSQQSQLTTTSPIILTTFFTGEMLPQPAGGRKYFPRVHRISKHRFLHYRNKQAYFLLQKICWL